MNKIKLKQIEDIQLQDVKLEEDLLVTSPVGVITNTSVGDDNTSINANGGYKISKGTTVEDALTRILTKDEVPAPTRPSITVSSNRQNNTVEIGTTVNGIVTINFNKESYTYGKYAKDGDTYISDKVGDCAPDTYKMTGDINETSQFSNSIVFDILASTEKEYRISTAVHYNESSYVAATKLRKKSNQTVSAGDTTAVSSKLFTAAKAKWFGFSDIDVGEFSDHVNNRALIEAYGLTQELGFSSGNNTASATASSVNDLKFFLIVPKGYNIISVFGYSGPSQSDYTSIVKSKNIDVADAGMNSQEYTCYWVETNMVKVGDRFEATFSK